MKNRKTIVQIMKEKVIKSGLSRREVSELAGVSKSWLDQVMQGKKINVMTDQVQAVIDSLDSEEYQ